MSSFYLIGDLGRISGLSNDTLNYYLRIGLIDEAGRTELTNYRYFNDGTVMELEQIKKLRVKKVPIKEILRRKEDGVL